MAFFSSSDIYLVASLAAVGLMYDESNQDSEGRSCFVWIKDGTRAREQADLYYKKALMANAKEICDFIKTIKTQLHNTTRPYQPSHTSSSPLDRLLGRNR